VNVWQDTTLRNCNVPQKLVQLLIVADGELEMTRDDTGLLVVTGGVASKFEDFSREVFKHGRKVDWGTSTDTLGVVALSQETVDTADGECEASFRGPAVKGKCQLNCFWNGDATCFEECRWSSERRVKLTPCEDQIYQMRMYLRLRALAAAGFASRFTSSHFG
jgi:hypothetical protein